MFAAVNSAMSHKQALITDITSTLNLELAPVPGVTMSIVGTEGRLEGRAQKFKALLAKTENGQEEARAEQLRRIAEKMVALKGERKSIEELRRESAKAISWIDDAVTMLEDASSEIAEGARDGGNGQLGRQQRCCRRGV